jgi:hypothetical protein
MVADDKGAYATVPDENRVLSFDSTSSKEVATNQNHPTFIAVDATFVYWVDNDGLKRCPRTPGTCGSTPALLTHLPLQPGGIAVRAGVVYGALRAFDLSGAPVPSGAVYRFKGAP